MSYDFDFDIIYVASLLNLIQRKATADGVYVDCPFCGKKEGKMHLNTEKNVFRCNRCGHSGGMITLYADVCDISNKEAYRKITEGLSTRAAGNSYSRLDLKKSNADVKAQDICCINDVYRALLNLLDLFDYHKEMLLKRGFSVDEIIKFGYKSMPVFGYKKIAEALISEGFNLSGIPGFYTDRDGKSNIKFRADSPGILIPNVDIYGRIVFLEKRLDTPYKETRYFRVSSSGELNGSKSVGCINFCGNPYDKNVYLTEGSFKSAIAHSLSGKTFAGMPGVSNYNLLYPFFKILKKNGTVRIIEALDMDKFTNMQVIKLREKILSIIKEFGFKVESVAWSSNYKGIDDYLMSFGQRKDFMAKD